MVPLESCLHNTTQKTGSLACKEYSINNQIIALRPTYINESCSYSNAVLEVNYGGKEKWRPWGIFGAIESLIVRWSHYLTLNVKKKKNSQSFTYSNIRGWSIKRRPFGW